MSTKMMTTAETGSFTALDSAAMGQMLEVLRENQRGGNEPMPIDIIKSPSSGSTIFTYEGLSGEESIKELTGIFLSYETPRAYWDTPEPSEGTPPLCYSKDSIVSTSGALCSECSFNEFGSNPKEGSNAKACKECVEIYLLRPEETLPIILRIPVSSKKAFRDYMSKLTRVGKSLYSVVSSVTLKKETNSGGQPYSRYVFQMERALSPEETEMVKKYRDEMQAILAK